MAKLTGEELSDLASAEEMAQEQTEERATEQEHFEVDVTVRKLYEVESETKRIHIVAYTKEEALRKLEKAMRDESMR